MLMSDSGIMERLRIEYYTEKEPKTETCGFCRSDFQPEGYEWADYKKCDYCCEILCEKCVINIDKHTTYCPNCVEGG